MSGDEDSGEEDAEDGCYESDFVSQTQDANPGR